MDVVKCDSSKSFPELGASQSEKWALLNPQVLQENLTLLADLRLQKLPQLEGNPPKTNEMLPTALCHKDWISFGPPERSEVIGLESERGIERSAARVSHEHKFKGSFFLIGGHADKTFAELVTIAPKNPKVVVVGRASGVDGADEDLARSFVAQGVRAEDITIVVPKGHKSKDTTFKHQYEVPKNADIVYFGGGKQDKLRNEFDQHQVKQVRRLLRHGSIVAGSSAGAAVMSEEMINGGNEKEIEHMRGFGLTPWAIVDTHVGQRHREARDTTALYDIGAGKRPVIGLDEDTRVRFYWKGDKLYGQIGGQGSAHWFQTAEMPELVVKNRKVMSKIITDGGEREAVVWDLKAGDVFEVKTRKHK